MSYDVGSATVSLASLVTDSPKCKELLSRIFLAIATEEKYRGKLVQQGGGKVSTELHFRVCLYYSQVNKLHYPHKSKDFIYS